jgi:hypothetical protein
VSKAEKLINRKVRTLVLSQEEYEGKRKTLNPDKALVLWQAE